jgi:hypothetical protein
MSGRDKRGSHRKPDEPFLMLTLSMAQDPAIFELSPIAAKTLLLFYRAHIHASAENETWFQMPRRWIVRMLGVSMSTADRVLAELEAARLIVQRGKRARRKPAYYRLALRSAEAVPMPAERNDGLQDAEAFNPGNVVMGDEVKASYVVMGDDSRARISRQWMKGKSPGRVGADSPSLATGGDGAQGRGGGPWVPPCGGLKCAKEGECLRYSDCPAEKLKNAARDGWPSR